MSEAAVKEAPPAGPFSGFERMVAWRYLRSRRNETVISVIASISFLGIMLGVAPLIVVHGGDERFPRGTAYPHPRHQRPSRRHAVDMPLEDYAELARRIDGVSGVKYAIPRSTGRRWRRAMWAPAPACWCAASAARTCPASRWWPTMSGRARWPTSTAARAWPSAGAWPRPRAGAGRHHHADLAGGDVTPLGTTPRLKGYPSRPSSRCACRNMTAPSSTCRFRRHSSIQHGRPGAEHRGLCRQSRCRGRAETEDRGGGAAADLHDRLAPAQPDLLLRAEVERNVMS